MKCTELGLSFRELNERNIISTDNVIYEKREAVLLSRESWDDIKEIHKVKKLFDGEAIEPPKNPEEWNTETGAIKALWKSRLKGPPKNRGKSKKVVAKSKKEQKIIQLDLFE